MTILAIAEEGKANANKTTADNEVLIII
jgi:hypothetical protein